MPLITQITRNGEQLQLGWGDFHIACIALAASFEAGANSINRPDKVYDVDPRTFECYPDAAFPVTPKLAFILADYGALAHTPLNYGEFTLTVKHRFMDVVDGEILTLLPGDVLRAVRH